MSQLLVHQRIETTLPKAKELRRVADQIVTMSKEVTSMPREEAMYQVQKLSDTENAVPPGFGDWDGDKTLAHAGGPVSTKKSWQNCARH